MKKEKWYKVIDEYLVNEEDVFYGGVVVYLNSIGLEKIKDVGQKHKILKEFESYQELIKYLKDEK